MPSNKPVHTQNFSKTCTKKRKVNVPKKVYLVSNISEIISSLIPIKYKDQGCPTIPCTIGQTEINKALLDLGAGINLFPYTVYQQLGLG